MFLEARSFEGTLAQHLATLWQALSGKEWMRCHIPVYGMAFYDEAGLILKASLCWECNNIYLHFPDGSTGFCAFNSQSPSAQELLAFCKEYLPRSAELKALTSEQRRRVEDALEGKPRAITWLTSSEELHAFVTAESILRPQHIEALWHIIRYPQCAKGTALWIFWHSEPLFWLSNFASTEEIAESPSRLSSVRSEALTRVPMLLEIQQRYQDGFYTRDTVAVDPTALLPKLHSPELKVPIAEVLRQPVFGDETQL
ncbi:hypothetical protein [Armatimonas sp.]|uniref:hypothetical protein n=1 Tax=Armatimonas sp. TaxID=1872638 RepID=UPI00286BB0DE|nr:hypothetical protein [Armatimonas sp.]